MDEDKASIKDRILETATILFAEKGFDGISMDELAKVANVNKSMIYYYFSSKDGLLVNLIQKHISEFEGLFSQIEIHKSTNIIAAVKEIIALAIDFISKNKNIMTILLQETMMKTPKTKIDIFNFINPVWDKIEKTLRASFGAIKEVSIIDKMLSVTLISNYVLFSNRMDIDDENELARLRADYVDRVTEIIGSLLGYTKKSDK
jgi:AcrR family transcriptional regulator